MRLRKVASKSRGLGTPGHPGRHLGQQKARRVYGGTARPWGRRWLNRQDRDAYRTPDFNPGLGRGPWK